MSAPQSPGSVPPVQRSPLQWLGVLLRGAAMGIAEVIPGVSGGTIAFISGIYDELLGSIARFGPASVGELFSRGLARFWQSHNLGFLLALLAGMGLSLVTIARLVKSALESTPPLVWAFFFGLIVASVVFLLRDLELRRALPFALIGLALGVTLALLPHASFQVSWWMLVLGGMVAVTAWILPGVSGSFMLLLMGLYPAVLAAVAEFNVVLLASLVLGCGLGLLLFARALMWLLARYRAPVLGGLTGIMAGSLLKLWPWQGTAGELLAPAEYAVQIGAPLLPGVCAMALAGLLAVAVLARFNPPHDAEVPAQHSSST